MKISLQGVKNRFEPGRIKYQWSWRYMAEIMQSKWQNKKKEGKFTELQGITGYQIYKHMFYAQTSKIWRKLLTYPSRKSHKCKDDIYESHIQRWAFSRVVKMPVKTLTSYIRVPGSVPMSSPDSNFLLMQNLRQSSNGWRHWVPATHVSEWFPSSQLLAQPSPASTTAVILGMNQQMEAQSVYPVSLK